MLICPSHVGQFLFVYTLAFLEGSINKSNIVCFSPFLSFVFSFSSLLDSRLKWTMNGSVQPSFHHFHCYSSFCVSYCIREYVNVCEKNKSKEKINGKELTQ